MARQKVSKTCEGVLVIRLSFGFISSGASLRQAEASRTTDNSRYLIDFMVVYFLIFPNRMLQPVWMTNVVL